MSLKIKKTLIDNSEKFKLSTYLNTLLQDTDCTEICIATGYWDLPGTKIVYEKLNCFLERGGKVKLIIGQEPILRSYQQKKDCEDSNKFPDFYIKRDIDQLCDEYIPVAKMLLKFCIDDENAPMQIRVYGQDQKPAKFLHSKCYIFKGTDSKGIIGSSNFTKSGLEDNVELNYLETDSFYVAAIPSSTSSTKGHILWFDEKWEQSVPWNGKFITNILKKSPVGSAAQKKQTELTPYEVYIKLLQHEFGEIIDKDNITELESYLPKSIMPLEYQFSAVNQCFATMKKHGGFFLSDVVGLGKTVVAVMLIKRFLNAIDTENRARKVLIITPPAIKYNWTDTIELFDKDSTDPIMPNVTMLTTGSIGKLLEDEISEELSSEEEIDSGEFNQPLDNNDYGLVLIDESHKFRNNNTEMYRSLDKLINDIYQTSGAYPYVGLLSATPQNNKPNDLKNQIYLFQRNPKDSTLDKVDGRNLEAFFSRMNKEYQNIIKTPKIDGWTYEISPDFYKLKEQNDKELINISSELREKVLSDVLIRRTRTDVKKHYAEDLRKQGITFPEISGPHELKYEMDEQLCRLFDETMNLIAPEPNFNFNDSQYLCYYRYRATEHLIAPEYRKKYQTRSHDVNAVGQQLAKIMQMLLVKRLESSFRAFKKSLDNLRRYTQNMITMLEKDCVFICPELNINEELNTKKNGLTLDECFDNIRLKIKKLDKEGRNEKKQNAEYRTADFTKNYMMLLKKDYELINSLCEKWQYNDYDPKLDTFKESINTELFDKEKNSSGKLVIFTEALDTLDALARAVRNKKHRPLVISAENRKEKEHIIRENFDANYSGKQKDDYDVIITTEVLAEGINLHRANIILNYDTPWNSTRLMQRIGRVNRIGSTAEKVHIFNFMPSAKGDRLINLVQKAHTKLQSFHILFGEDSKIFSNAEQVSSYDDLKTFVEGEESPLQKYIGELKEYRDKNPVNYTKIKQNRNILTTAVTGDGSAYYVIKNNKTKGLYIKYDNETAQTIPTLDFLESFRSYTYDAQAIPPPKHTKEMEQKAILCFNRHFVRISRIKEHPTIRQAKRIAHSLMKNNLNEKTEEMLSTAYKMLEKGNRSVAQSFISIENHLNQNNLFELNDNDISDYIAGTLHYIDKEIEKSDGKAHIIISLITKSR